MNSLISALIFTFVAHSNSNQPTPEYLQRLMLATLPDTYDSSLDASLASCWPSILNQGSCGSCYAHAACFAFSARVCKKYGVKYDANIQEVTACTNGCDGGFGYNGFQYMADYGVGPAACREYVDSNIGECTYDICDDDTLTDIKYFCKPGEVYGIYLRDVSSVDYYEELIKSEIYNNGPITTQIIASDSNNTFQNYQTTDYANVFQISSDNDNASADHEIVMIGWTPTEWIIANSWGTSWGYNGYAKIKKGIRKLGSSGDFCTATDS